MDNTPCSGSKFFCLHCVQFFLIFGLKKKKLNMLLLFLYLDFVFSKVFGTYRAYDPKDRVNPRSQLDPKTGKSLEYTAKAQ